MKRITFITDHTFEERGYGGLEVTQRELIARVPDGLSANILSIDQVALGTGITIAQGDIPPHRPTIRPSDLPAFLHFFFTRPMPDLIVFTNVVRWPREMIDALAKSASFCKYELDYNFCKTRLKNCVDSCKECISDGWYQEFLQGAERVFFTCPAQKDAYRKILGTVADNSILNPSWIDPDQFPNLGWERIPNTGMYHGRLFPHKGVLATSIYAATNDLQFTFVGDGPPEIERFLERAGSRVLRHATPQLIPYLLNATERWVMLSDWDDTGPMSALEAYLCGAKVVHNGRLGYFSHPWNWDDPESVRTELKNIAPRFWGEIQRILEEI